MAKNRAAPAPAPGDTDAAVGGRSQAANVHAPHSPPPPAVVVAMLSKAEQSRVEYRGGKGELLGLGEIYLNDLSDIFVFEVANQMARKLKLQLRAELRKPFQSSQWGFQLENENVSIMQRELQQEKDRAVASDEFNHVPFSVLRSSSKAALCAENVYLCEGYNELFNHIGTVDEIVLGPKETKRITFSMCTNLTPQHNATGNSAYVAAGDSSEEERAHLSETSCFVLSGRLILQPSFVDGSVTSRLPIPEMLVPLQAQVCRSLLRLDVKELHFDDCVPGGSFVKDFTVWNRSEIPLLFKLVSPMTPWSENNELLVCTDYNSGYVIGDKTLQAAAYGHVRIRVTYRPTDIGERFFEIQAQNLHDSRNVKTLRIHAITNQEHHREGLSIKEPDGSYLMSGSRLDFGDCYTGIASSKVILMRNMTEVALHVELTSDRPKEVTFELKLQQNRSRVSRAPRTEELLSPTNSNDGSSLKGSLSPDRAKTLMPFSNVDAYGLDSDEEVDDNEGDFYEEDFQQTKRNSFEENPMGDGDDLDDDFEFDREPRALPESPLGSPKMRGSRGSADLRKKTYRTKGKKSSKVSSRVRGFAYDSGVDSPRSSPERNLRTDTRKRQTVPVDDNSASNFLVEIIDLPPGVERTILIWYSPASSSNLEGLHGENADAVDLKAARLTKQTFRMSFRCFLMQGAWQQAQSRVYDRTLGKSIHIRARTCTSMVTVSPSILHLGDCNIGELKSSSCMLTNHSELPTVVKPLVTSKVISTVPNDDMMLGPKQSTELKIEIIPRKTNPNYSRLISIINMKNKSNIPQICVRSSNMDAHHVIYHSLFYKLLTQSRSAFLNFEHVAINSVGIQVFDLENITNAPLHLNIQSSAPSKVRLYCIKHPFGDVANPPKMLDNEDGEARPLSSSKSTTSQGSAGSGTPSNAPTQISQPPAGRPIRRRRSFGSVSELTDGKAIVKRGKSIALRELLTKKLTAISTSNSSTASPAASSVSRSVSNQHFESDRGRQEQHSAGASESRGNPSHATGDERRSPDGSSSGSLLASATSSADGSSLEEVASLLELFAKSRSECDAYCHSSLPSKEKEEEIVAMVRERTKRLQTLFAEKKLVLLSSNKERNVRIPAKSRQRIVAVFSPVTSETAVPKDVAKTRVEKHKIMITLPPGGNKKAVTDGGKFDQNKPVWAASKHPFDTRSSVRELLLKSRVCRSIMNVNQKNINFGRITTSSKSSKRLVVQNMSATPLVYSVEKTGSISSGFLQIKEGEVGVVKAFGTKEICFQFQPTLAGPFEEKLKIINVQDPENSVSVTIKAKVVKRETFKLLQSGQTISFGKCIVGEKTDEVKIAVRNTSRKKREYVIQLDPSFTVPTLRPTFYFSVDETPATVITQAQEKKLDEELEKLEHKLRIAITKKKTDKIVKLNAKISQVKALLSGEQLPKEPGTPADSDPEATGRSGGSSEVGESDPYDSGNSDSEMSESESSSHSRRRRSRPSDKPIIDVKTGLVSSSTNTLHFSLGAEATGRVVAYAIFNPLRSGDISPRGEDGDKSGARQSQKMKKRLLRRDAIPIVGVGKFLLFEQQNKDVVKELQYNAEIFSRTPAGESAFCRAVGRKPPSALPPHPNSGVVPTTVGDSSVESLARKPHETGGGSILRYDDVIPSLTAPPGIDSAKVEHRRSLTIKIPDSGKTARKLNLDIAPDQLGVSPTSSNLLVSAEESPADTRGWTVTLSLGSPSYKGSGIVEVVWNPAVTFRNVLALTCEVVPHDFLISGEMMTASGATESSDLRTMLPLKLNIPPDRTVNLNLKWCFTSDAGFALSTPLASCVSRSILESVSEAAELNAGQIDFFYHPSNSSPDENVDVMTRTPISSVGVAIVKAVQRSLCFETDTLDLGEHQQGEDVKGEVVIHNRSHQALQFLLLAGSRDQGSVSTSSTVSPLLVGGDMTFENATGTVEAGSFVKAAFVYKGSVPGQHTEQIVLRNLSGDRLDTSVLALSVRITRPVYVRVPELDPQSTGQLEVLNLGPCYVTPEMQDTAVDSPNVSLRFSKVHKLTLQSQVEHTLVICASSNLKTQCYVYEDARLHREASHVVMKGNQCIDLYVAIRPRLSSDAVKTGSTRDLVGGIRVQLFGLQTTHDSSEEEKSEMLAEFTVKFVGVAGASIARVTPSLIDFGVEYNSGQMQTCQTHEGRFELINMSKALPLGYRLFVTSAAESYSDDDDALHISLKHEKGEISPGETGIIEFRMMAYTNGLFRRRIMVENIHYPGRVTFVDVVLFVDNGALLCEIPGANGDVSSTYGTTQERSSLQSVDFGLINVIRLEDELTDSMSTSGGESESTSRRYRIYGERSNGPFFEVGLGMVGNTMSQQPTAKTLVLTNTTDQAMVVRPLSTLPLRFEWKREGHEGKISKAVTEQGDLMGRSTSTDSARRLHTPPLDITPRSQQPCIFYGESYSLEAKSSCLLSFHFASIAATVPLPTDTIENGKLCPLRGMVGIQSFESDNGTDAEEACTLKVVNISGFYGEPRFQIAEKCLSLGKIGYGIGWKSSTFQICVRNVSDVAVSFVIANLPACIHVLNVRDGSRIQFYDGVNPESGLHVPSLRMLALHAENTSVSNEASRWSAWKVQPRTSCVLEMELMRTAEFLAAGAHEFPLRFFNLCNPHNHEDVVVRAQIISSYAELAVDPESSDYGVEVAEPKERHIAFLPPVTVPTPPEAPPHRASFWFSLRNVYDEELIVKISSQTHSAFDQTFELLLMLRSANTPLSSLVIAPGESVDIRVVCHVLPSARLPADTWSTGSSGATSEILDLGRVWLDISIQNMEDAAQREEIHVKGKLLPGKTFLLSASSLHFFATATEIPADIPVDQLPSSLKSKTGVSRDSSQITGASQQTTASVVHQLRNSSEIFWVRNPSTAEVLNFVINPVSMYQPGLCLVEGSTESDMCAMSEWIQAIAVPSSGTIAPGESVKVTVHLEEASAPSSNTAPFHEASDTRPAGKIAALHKMRHHPSWRSNSWDADGPETTTEESGQNHMFLTVRDADSSFDAGVSTEIDVLLVLQQQSSAGDAAKQGGVVLDKTLITAAFEARNKRLAQSRKLYPVPTLETHLEDELFEETESSGLDNFEEFDISSIRSGAVGRKNHLPVLTIRGCTPAEYSSLENTRYLIDVGQHTVRNGGEVEWEITIESLYSAASAASAADPGLDSVEYRLMLVDKNARSWLQLSRERGTLDRPHSYQSVVLYFLRGVVGVYSTFMVLQNLANPSDLKVIHVRLEVIADLNSLRGMSSGLDAATNLFRVLVSNHGSPKRLRRSSIEMPPEISAGGAQRLMIDLSEVYYYKLYQNHSIVIENSSGLSLDFILSTNARPQEVSFSVSPLSFNEVTTVTLGAHTSMQVFLHFRPQPKQPVLPSASNEVVSDVEMNEPWVREIEVYVSCRLVKDFRETVIIRAICSQPQLLVQVANGETNDSPLQRETYFSAQPTFLGLVFPMLESTLSSPELSTKAADETQKYLVVRNTKSDSYARLALRNDSLFFSLAIDDILTQPGAATVDLLDQGVCAGRRSTLLVTIQPQSVAVFRVKPDVAALWKHHQLWDHSVKEHVTLYNIKQFAEHYQVTLCFSCSNVASFYIPPNISESYPISALEDIVAKFLQNYEYTWKWLISYHEKTLVSAKHSGGQSSPASKLAEILNDLENALDLASPLSPRNLTHAAMQTFDEEESAQTTASRDDLYQLVQSYRALYFDFYYITDELVWYGVRGNAVRHSLALADLAYGVVFDHEVFRSFVSDARSESDVVAFPRLLLPWIRQLGHFLSFFPENQEATQPLRQVYDQLRKFEAS
ncbi:hypothetical protein PC129_g3389 [Phytophthora cactorum]|uniref:Uncharacterized protein n=1 Tax=Phytophthora cactorum TaxID=29920 RepID=A0A329T1F9_9STRA|nr:hypothetical protein Pcac1_g16614 [Phytophthora cactorum]KAG2842011.1 hypothetical protein PC112_g3152 [Phytophthora cactorum]KAG2843745.1 hypothetical protein PC111_g2232 [Phytophthora cactorum]KAG2865809.1 hypothetical protein PC113_g3375 [Phytophthora cactorum]KAG2926916.1 hypothetical protein PC114_g3656 [Phytophthora cactorum]